MNNSENKRRFNGDPYLFDKINRIRVRQIVGCVIGVGCIIGFFVFSGMQEEAHSRDAYEFFNILKILCIAFGVLEIIMSPITLYISYKDEQKLAKSYIEVSDSGVSGISFSHKADMTGHLFNVSYDDIVLAAVISDPTATEGNNILIKAKTDKYYGYSIENHSLAVRLINQKKAEYHEKQLVTSVPQPNEVKNTQTTSNAEINAEAEKYCLYCGTRLISSAIFCSKCGKAQ